MLSYFLKCTKNTEIKKSRIEKAKNGKITLHHIVWFAIVKNQDFSKSEKLVVY